LFSFNPETSELRPGKSIFRTENLAESELIQNTPCRLIVIMISGVVNSYGVGTLDRRAVFPVHKSQIDRLGQVAGIDGLLTFQVRDGAGDAKHAGVGPG